MNQLVKLGASGASAIAGGVTAGFGAVSASLGSTASTNPAVDGEAMPRVALERGASVRGALPSHLMR